MGRVKERGHLMAGLVAAMAILLIMSSVAIQAWEDRLRRENEAEMISRADQLVRAIRRFQKDQGRLPTKLEELMEPGARGQYFLRRLYEDPLVRNGKWGLLYQSPDGGILDPNAPALEATREIGVRTTASADVFGGLNPTLANGPREVQGLPIVGVKSLCTERPFRVLKGSSDYSQWLFSVYDLQNQQGTQTGSTPRGSQPGKNPQVPGGGS